MTHSNNSVQEPESNGQKALQKVGHYLESDGWFPQQLGELDTYQVLYNGQNGLLRCFASVRIDLEQFIFYAVASVKAPEATRPAIAEYITRANYGLRIGNFEMDYNDGEIRYKSSLDFEGQPLTDNLIRNTIYPAVQTMDKYLPGLLNVMHGGQAPTEAIQAIEES